MCGLFGGGGSTPTIVRETPEADAAKAAADATAKAGMDKLETKRRRKAASLLATGGQGDTTAPATGMPSAAASKPTLGA